MKVFIIGYMASGKSRLGAELAEVTGYPLVDLDDLFEETYRISVGDFFEKYDETSFRRLEQELLMETGPVPNLIVSTGGGTPCYLRNMDFIKMNGVSVYLRINARVLSERLITAKKKRPLLTDVEPSELEAIVRKHLEVREPYYLQADHIIQAHEIKAETILNLIPGLPRKG